MSTLDIERAMSFEGGSPITSTKTLDKYQSLVA
jgi:hypothetical protein